MTPGCRPRRLRRCNGLTLARLFLGATVGVTFLFGGLLVAFLESSRQSMLQRAQVLRESAALRVETEVHRQLRQGQRTLQNVERSVRSGAVDVSRPGALETLLTTELLDDDQAVGISLTHADKLGFDASGQMRTAPGDRWALSVFRLDPAEPDALSVRSIERVDEAFVVIAGPGAGATPDAQHPALRQVGDPTEEATFRATTSAAQYGKTVYGDLGFLRDEGVRSQGDLVVQTVRKAIEDGTGKFVGVVSVSLPAQALDAIARLRVNPADPSDPHRIFVCDPRGRLVTRLSNDERFVVTDGVLRVEPHDIPPPIALALSSPLLKATGPDDRDRSGALEVDGQRYLVTFHWVSRPQGWIAGLVVPEDYYVHDLVLLRRRFLTAYAGVTVIVLAVGLWALRALLLGLGQVRASTDRMRRFDFSPLHGVTVFADVQQTIDSLERAKTVVRAMERYVPVDLVRELYASNRDPALGGRLDELTIMFSDIRDFTALAERLTPDALARALGHYFETLTSVITAAGGTVDKYIGDSIMAFWNAPGSRPGHPAYACRAVLGCIAAAKRLYASPEWGGLPPLFTRFGVNTGPVMVGHFGSPARLTYTALGDAVNLASRLESLCKLYGVASLVSESVRHAAGNGFVFRLIDLVAVKGKTQGVGVYELLGFSDEDIRGLEVAHAYERAHQAYAHREFDTALTLLEACKGDGPSVVLAERCRRYLIAPPPPDWDGIFRPELK
jgi:adenylate cyclase